jgi:hypothetical protein
MKNLLVILTLLISGLVSVAAIAENKNEIPEYTVEGLKLVPGTKGISYVWAEIGANLTQYQRIYLMEPEVAFKKNWKQEQNRNSLNKVSNRDMELIKKNVSKLFTEVFTEELESGGYTLANERAHDVLLVKPAIINLDVNAPDNMIGGSGTVNRSAGAMTLYMELYDSETDDLLAKALDPSQDRGDGFLKWTNSASNRVAGKKMMKPWAEALRKGLDDARDPDNQN